MTFFEKFRRAYTAKPKEILNNIAWVSFERLVQIVFGLLTTVILARYLDVENFAIWFFALNLWSIGVSFTLLGLDQILSRELVENKARARALLAVASRYRFISALLIVSLIIGYYFLVVDEKSDTLFLVLGFMLASLFFQSAQGYFLPHIIKKQAKPVAVLRTGIFALANIARLVIAVHTQNLVLMAVVFIAEAGLSSLLLIKLFSQDNGHRFTDVASDLFKRPTASNYARLRSDLLPAAASVIGITIYMKVDILMLEQMTSLTVVAMYSLAVKVSATLYAFLGAANVVLSPMLNRAHKISPQLYERKLVLSFYCVLLLTVITAFLFSITARYWVPLIFSERFTQSVPIIVIHIWSSVFVVFGLLSTTHLIIERQVKVSAYRIWIGAAANVSLNFVLIPKYGAAGAAGATILSFAISAYLSGALFRQSHEIFKIQTQVLFLYHPLRFLWKRRPA